MVFGRHDVKISLWRNKNVAKLKKEKKRNALDMLGKRRRLLFGAE